MTLISFAIASYNSGPFLAASVRSALAQRDVAVEVLIVDDGSSDESWALAESLAAGDARVRAFRTPENLGPGGARNIALDQALGTWFAVLDSDDLIHPDRSARLIAEAVASGADLIADDLIVFDHTGTGADLFLSTDRTSRADWLTLEAYFGDTVMFGPRPNLGFLKPVVRTDFLRTHAIRYDQRLRIAEDDDLIVQLLLAGARYRLLPEPLYFYRKHGASISHRLSVEHADRMMAAAERLRARVAGLPVARSALFRKRDRAMIAAHAFTHAIDALKRRSLVSALSIVARSPGAWPLFRMPLAGAMRKIVPRRTLASRAPDPAAVLLISKQRIMGATNGSSAYVLSLAQAVRAAGRVPHLLQPSSTLFGRTPFFRLRPEMAVFASHVVKDGARVGPWLIAMAPRIWLAALRGITARVLKRAGFKGNLVHEAKADYAIATPWTSAERLFVARHGRGRGGVALADYVFQTEALPYLIDPDARSAIIMHDLFHARSAQFAAGGATDSVALLDGPAEMAMMARADAVIAIQAAEADWVRVYVPGVLPVLAPMAADPVSGPQPGDGRVLLFVGSNTAPNVVGLRWFLAEVWPAVSRAIPGIRLDVAGKVAEALTQEPPPGVRILGLVDDLAALYASAGIVISPLLQGSGLKIKLIEALAHGKASVVTSVTLQGVEAQLVNAVRRADDPMDFAAAIIDLSLDDRARAALAENALSAARSHFGAEACYADFRAWISG